MPVVFVEVRVTNETLQVLEPLDERVAAEAGELSDLLVVNRSTERGVNQVIGELAKVRAVVQHNAVT